MRPYDDWNRDGLHGSRFVSRCLLLPTLQRNCDIYKIHNSCRCTTANEKSLEAMEQDPEYLRLVDPRLPRSAMGQVDRKSVCPVTLPCCHPSASYLRPLSSSGNCVRDEPRLFDGDMEQRPDQCHQLHEIDSHARHMNMTELRCGGRVSTLDTSSQTVHVRKNPFP